MLRTIIVVFTIFTELITCSQQVLVPFSGAVTESSATIIISSPTAATIKIEYSENPDFTGSAGTGEQLPAEGSGYSKHQANVLKPDTCNYCRALMETIDE